MMMPDELQRFSGFSPSDPRGFAGYALAEITNQTEVCLVLAALLSNSTLCSELAKTQSDLVFEAFTGVEYTAATLSVLGLCQDYPPTDPATRILLRLLARDEVSSKPVDPEEAAALVLDAWLCSAMVETAPPESVLAVREAWLAWGRSEQADVELGVRAYSHPVALA